MARLGGLVVLWELGSFWVACQSGRGYGGNEGTNGWQLCGWQNSAVWVATGPGGSVAGGGLKTFEYYQI